MFEIQGKMNTAVCYAKVVEDGAVEQIRRMCDYTLTENSRVRIMPDVHAGKGCTIGTTMTVTDKACPNIVGVDIGCGMYTVKLAEKELDFARIDEAAHYIPSGMNTWEGRIERFDLTGLRCFRSLCHTPRLERSLGTLGGGNHFIEIDKASDGTYYLVIHSGSRNLGKQVAELYQKLAVDLHSGKEDYFVRRDEIIRTYKAEGRRCEIQQALKTLEKDYKAKTPDAPEDLCWLYGAFLEDYLHDVEICQQFARRSREKMAEILLERTGMTGTESFHTVHNYIDTDEMILRKGAIAAHAGERVLIPINMRDGSVLAVGKGNPEWNYSAPHGAGRIMSRSRAKEEIDMEAYKAAMEGIYTTSVSEQTIDEAPMAYKSIDDIIDVIRESVDIMDIMKPVYNFKASDDDLPWKRRKDELNLNAELLKVCTSDVIDYDLAESLLVKGAKPLGKITDYGFDNNLYDEIIEFLFRNEETPEDFYRITELFLRYGMDISKPSVPYDGDNVLNPIFRFAFPSNEVVLRTLKLLLDNGLSADDAGVCWGLAISDFVNVDGGLTTDLEYEYYYDYIRKLMLIASYPRLLNSDKSLQNEIWFQYNDYDITRFRNWHEFSFDIDTSHCDRHPEVHKSLVTIKEKSSGKAVWKFGVSMKPEDVE